MMGAYDFSRERITEHLQTLKTAGGTVDEMAWAGQLHDIVEKNPEVHLPDAEAQAWENVILNNMKGSANNE